MLLLLLRDHGGRFGHTFPCYRGGVLWLQLSLLENEGCARLVFVAQILLPDAQWAGQGQRHNWGQPLKQVSDAARPQSISSHCMLASRPLMMSGCCCSAGPEPRC